MLGGSGHCPGTSGRSNGMVGDHSPALHRLRFASTAQHAIHEHERAFGSPRVSVFVHLCEERPSTRPILPTAYSVHCSKVSDRGTASGSTGRLFYFAEQAADQFVLECTAADGRLGGVVWMRRNCPCASRPPLGPPSCGQHRRIASAQVGIGATAARGAGSHPSAESAFAPAMRSPEWAPSDGIQRRGVGAGFGVVMSSAGSAGTEESSPLGPLRLATDGIVIVRRGLGCGFGGPKSLPRSTGSARR